MNALQMERFYNSVHLPVISFGMCLNASKRRGCKGWQVELGDELCVKCWDKAMIRDIGRNRSKKKI